jgi:hypothetical protein
MEATAWTPRGEGNIAICLLNIVKYGWLCATCLTCGGYSTISNLRIVWLLNIVDLIRPKSKEFVYVTVVTKKNTLQFVALYTWNAQSGWIQPALPAQPSQAYWISVCVVLLHHFLSKLHGHTAIITLKKHTSFHDKNQGQNCESDAKHILPIPSFPCVVCKKMFHLQEMENLQLPVNFCFVLFKMGPQQIPKNNHDQAWPT